MPRIHYAQQYQRAFDSSYSPSDLAAGTPLYNYLYTEDTLNDKVRLRNQLNSGKLSNMPAGFPFHHVCDGSGNAFVSYDSYEFKTESRATIRSGHRSRQQGPAISYTCPSGYSTTTSKFEDYLQWKVYLPSRENNTTATTKHTQDRIAHAHVRVEPAVMRTSYGAYIKDDPQTILQALAISLELGVLITIEVSDMTSKTQHALLARSKSTKRLSHQFWRSGTVLYIGTHNNGKQELLYAVEPKY